MERYKNYHPPPNFLIWKPEVFTPLEKNIPNKNRTELETSMTSDGKKNRNSGAETGAGGRIRDGESTGKGSLVRGTWLHEFS